MVKLSEAKQNTLLESLQSFHNSLYDSLEKCIAFSASFSTRAPFVFPRFSRDINVELTSLVSGLQYVQFCYSIVFDNYFALEKNRNLDIVVHPIINSNSFKFDLSSLETAFSDAYSSVYRNQQSNISDNQQEWEEYLSLGDVYYPIISEKRFTKYVKKKYHSSKTYYEAVVCLHYGDYENASRNNGKKINLFAKHKQKKEIKRRDKPVILLQICQIEKMMVLLSSLKRFMDFLDLGKPYDHTPHIQQSPLIFE